MLDDKRVTDTLYSGIGSRELFLNSIGFRGVSIYIWDSGGPGGWGYL